MTNHHETPQDLKKMARYIVNGALKNNTARMADERLEDEIGRCGLWEEYTRALCLICGVETRAHTSLTPDWILIDGGWALIRATPEQRARAFLEVITKGGSPCVI